MKTLKPRKIPKNVIMAAHTIKYLSFVAWPETEQAYYHIFKFCGSEYYKALNALIKLNFQDFADR